MDVLGLACLDHGGVKDWIGWLVTLDQTFECTTIFGTLVGEVNWTHKISYALGRRFDLLPRGIKIGEEERTVKHPKGPTIHLCEASSNQGLKKVHL